MMPPLIPPATESRIENFLEFHVLFLWVIDPRRVQKNGLRNFREQNDEDAVFSTQKQTIVLKLTFHVHAINSDGN